MKCFKCGAEMNKAILSGSVERIPVSLHGESKGFIEMVLCTEAQSAVDCFVCPEC